MRQARILRIVVASPGDVQPERDALELIVDEINHTSARDRGLRLELLRWETEAYPGFHVDGPQGLIDPILNIEDCDLLIGIFWKHFGTPTGDADSGTEHEIKQAYAAWQRNQRPQIMIYFNQVPVMPASLAEVEQLHSVIAFKTTFPQEGLWWGYNGQEDFNNKARQHLTRWLSNNYPLPSTHSNIQALPQSSRHEMPARDLLELRKNYRDVLRRSVSNVRLFGNDSTRDLGEVFVSLSIIEDSRESPRDRRLMGMMDAGLRRKLSIFTYDSDESYGYSLGGREKTHTVMPDELLREGRQAVVTGAPGCGKTTLLKFLALQAEQKETDHWVVFLELKTVHAEDLKAARNLQELLFTKAIAERLDLNEAEKEKLRAHFFASLQSGKASLFLDGLDEVRHQSLFGDLCNAVSEFVQDSNYRRNILILSTRPFGLHRAPLGGLQQMEIQPLDQKQVESILRSYYPGDKTAQKLALDLRKPGDLRELARSPVMLAGIIELYRENNAPIETARRLDIYEKITRRLIVKLDLEKNAQRYSFRLTDPDGTLKRDFLQQLAFERLLLDKNDADTEASRFIFSADDLLAKAKAFVRSEGLHDIHPHTLADDAKATALLREVSEDKYAFAHTTLQEYLAAKMLARYEDREKVFARTYFNHTLVAQEILPMTLGLIGQADGLYEVLERLPESLTLTNLRLQLRGLCYAANISQGKLKKLLDRTAQFLVAPSNEEEAYRRVILRSLWFLTDRAREYLEEKILPQLTGWSSIDKIRAAEALAVVGSEKSIEPLIRVLDPNMSEGDLGSRMIFASSSFDSQTANVICRALARIDPQKAVPVLASVSSIYTYGEIEWILQRIGTEEANKAILVRRTRGADWRSTQAARELLAQSKNQDVAELLVTALHHRDDEIRGMAVEILGSIGLKKYVMPLTECLRDPHPTVRWKTAHALERAAHTLGRADSENAVEPLIEALHDSDSTVRWGAARTLGVIGSDKAVEALIASLGDPSNEVQDCAASSLGWIRDERAIEPLLKLLAEGSGKARRAAVSALGEFKVKNVIKALIQYLADADPEMRSGAAYSLGRTRSEEAVDPLIGRLADDSPGVRRGAAFALGLIGSEKAVSHLLNTMHTDKDYKAREPVLEALGEIGAVEAVEPLMEAHINSHGDGHAAKALSQIHSANLALALPRLFGHENKLVRAKAAQVVGYYCDGQGVIDELSRLAQADPEEEVRAAAQKTIDMYKYKSTLLSFPASS